MAAKRQRDYKREYAARVARAKREGYRGYGQKRYQTQKQQRLLREAQAKLTREFPEAVEPLTIPQQRALNLLKEWDVNKSDIEKLRNAGPDFWKQARPILERESELRR